MGEAILISGVVLLGGVALDIAARIVVEVWNRVSPE